VGKSRGEKGQDDECDNEKGTSRCRIFRRSFWCENHGDWVVITRVMIGQSFFFCRGQCQKKVRFRITSVGKKNENGKYNNKKVRADAEFSGGHFGAKITIIV
jgi:hypothetical protein